LGRWLLRESELGKSCQQSDDLENDDWNQKAWATRDGYEGKKRVGHNSLSGQRLL
jgi:hypothetical protein